MKKFIRCRIVKTDDNLSERVRASVKPVKITVAIAEDDAPLRGILSEWIRAAEGLKFVGMHENAEVAIAALPWEKPAIVLMDINMPRHERHRVPPQAADAGHAVQPRTRFADGCAGIRQKLNLVCTVFGCFLLVLLAF